MRHPIKSLRKNNTRLLKTRSVKDIKTETILTICLQKDSYFFWKKDVDVEHKWENMVNKKASHFCEACVGAHGFEPRTLPIEIGML